VPEGEEALGGSKHHRADDRVAESSAGGALDTEPVDKAEDLDPGGAQVVDVEVADAVPWTCGGADPYM
jgi:hypothetical protein